MITATVRSRRANRRRRAARITVSRRLRRAIVAARATRYVLSRVGA